MSLRKWLIYKQIYRWLNFCFIRPSASFFLLKLNMTKFSRIFSISSLLVLSSAAIAAPVGVDGVLGPEWNGITPTLVNSIPNAPYTPPSSPGLLNSDVSYDVYLRADSQYVYGFLQSIGSTNGLDFANLYFNTDLVGGSDWGMEVTNDRAFVPGGNGTYYDLSAYLTFDTVITASGTSIEWALPWSYFSTDPQNILPDATNVNNGIQLRTSQSFGYNGVTGDPVTRFGTVAQPAALAVPEPGSLALVGLALAGLGWARRRKV